MTKIRNLNIFIEEWPLIKPFTISRGTDNSAVVIVVRVDQDGKTGWGESTPYARYDETTDSVKAAIEACRTEIETQANPDVNALGLRGAAANALDCALIDLAAKLKGKPAWRLLGESEPKALITTTTITLGDPDSMAEDALLFPDQKLIKIKLGSADGDLERVAAVHKARPDAKLICDANEGWSVDQLIDYAPRLKALGIEMIEQPCPAGDDEGLRGLDLPITLCADESCHVAADVASLVGKYQMVNIKLDKTGGLHGALDLVKAAKSQDMGIMVGCMLSTSLAMAPGLIVGQHAEYVDLDAPLALRKDRDHCMEYADGLVHPASPALWG